MVSLFEPSILTSFESVSCVAAAGRETFESCWHMHVRVACLWSAPVLPNNSPCCFLYDYIDTYFQL